MINWSGIPNLARTVAAIQVLQALLNFWYFFFYYSSSISDLALLGNQLLFDVVAFDKGSVGHSIR